MVTQKDIARKCKVSVAAVSAAFKRPEHLSRETRERILSAALELGYLSEKLEIKNIGLVFNNFFNHYFSEFYSEIVYGILERLSELKLRAQIFNRVPEKYSEICEISGFLVVGNNSTPFARDLKAHRLPFVLVDCTRKLEEAHHLIYFESSTSAKQLAEYVLSCNHRQIAIINGETDPEDTFWLRYLEGVKKAFTEKGLSIKNLRIYPADYNNIQTLEIAINALLSAKKKITCIMCSNDWLAYHAGNILHKYGVKVPRDISLTGFDGLHLPDFLISPLPKLTTVFSDRVQLGRQAVDLLLDVLRHPQKSPKQVIVDTKFALGDSVRRLSTFNQ